MSSSVGSKTTDQKTLANLEHEKNVCNEPLMKLNQILEGNPIPTFVIDSDSKIPPAGSG